MPKSPEYFKYEIYHTLSSITQMGCNGICHRTKYTRIPGVMLYCTNKKYCSTCCVYFETKKMYCECCHYKLRGKAKCRTNHPTYKMY